MFRFCQPLMYENWLERLFSNGSQIFDYRRMCLKLFPRIRIHFLRPLSSLISKVFILDTRVYTLRSLFELHLFIRETITSTSLPLFIIRDRKFPTVRAINFITIQSTRVVHGNTFTPTILFCPEININFTKNQFMNSPPLKFVNLIFE